MAKPQKPPEKKQDVILSPDTIDRIKEESRGMPAQEPALTTQYQNVPAPPGTMPMIPATAPETLVDGTRWPGTPEGGVPVAESNREPTAETLLGDLLAELAPQQDDGESALSALRRLLTKVDALERDREDIADVNHVLTFGAGMPPTGSRSEGARVRALVEKVKALEAQLQPAHNVLGKHANARGVLLSHVKGSGPSYDVGGKYRLALVTVKDGQVSISEAADVVAGLASHELPFGLVRDHLEKRLEDYLTPEAHRS